METLNEIATIYVAYSDTHEYRDAIYYVKYLMAQTGVEGWTVSKASGSEGGALESVLRIEIAGNGLSTGKDGKRSPILGIVDSLKSTFDQKRVLVVFSQVHAHIV